MNQNEKKKAVVIASTRLTENQVHQAIMDLLFKDEDFVKSLSGLDVVMRTKWHVSKWDDPDILCTLTFGVVEDEEVQNSSESLEEVDVISDE
jgi:hypothetical protein